MRRSWLLCLMSATLYAASGVQPQQLRCEYRTNPQGIDVVEPRLSWSLVPRDPKARGLYQTAYRILVSSSEQALANGNGDLWDSGKVPSDQSIQVIYRGHPLTSRRSAWWKVRVWDQDGEASEWSQPAQWSMGLLSPEDWHGQWIGLDEAGVVRDPGSPYQALEGARWIWSTPNAQTGAPAGDRYFRESFTVAADRKIARALCIVGADNQAQVFVNGELVAANSNTTLPAVKDIAALIHPGDNSIAVRAAHGRDNTRAGLIGAVRVEFADGEPLLVQTGAHWHSTAKPEAGWEKPGYLDAAWPNAKELGEYGMTPWGDAGFAAEHRLPVRMLRREFAVAGGIRRATVSYCGLGLSELYLNGVKVGDHVLSPGLTDYDKHLLYETFDVTRFLASGRNAIGLMLGNGRFYAPRGQAGTRNFGYPKAIVQLDIEKEDGSRESIVSDESWKLSTAGPIRANNEYDGEEYDARMEIAGWSGAGFDDSEWQAAQQVPAPGGTLTAQMAEPLRVTETLHPVSVKQLKPGVYVFDMGQNMVGWCRLKVAGPKGTQIRLRHAETLNPDGSLYTANLRTAAATDLYTLKGVGTGMPDCAGKSPRARAAASCPPEGTEIWEPRFTYHGFRYVEMTGFPGVPAAGALEGRVVHDDMSKSADFVSSNELLNQIHHNMFWGIRGNYRSIPTDCPQRDERQGWLGDRSQVSRSESYMFDVAAFYSKWMNDLEDSQRPNGSIPVVSPNYWPLYFDDLTWPSTFLFVPGMLYDQYGDRRVLETHYPAMKKWIDHERTFLTNGLMPKDQYGDWCVPPEDPKLIHSQDPARITDKMLLGTAYYYELLRLMARYARLLDKPPDAADFDTLADQVHEAFQKRFYKPLESRYDNGTQTSSILPLYFQMVPVENRAAVLDHLTRKIEQESNGHVGTGLVGAQWLMRTLSDNGRSDVAYRIATQKTYPGWGYMVEKGATTIWELWNGDTADPAMNSGNHVMQIGDLAVWMYEYLAGIRSDPDNPGFRHILIHPYPAGDLTFVKGTHQSMYGTIASSWKREGGTFTLEVTVPANTTATVWMPAKDASAVTESGHPVSDVPGVKPLRSEGAGGAVFEVASGTYSFRSPL
ncbi:MAG TPA: family 78 glycoside hydrolase catalytic domain [Bryobacteraceae bacterium]|nr:family 78 glycoside hydrolase catalytic domain [Bryobacteraceae bacterium]